MQTSTLFIEKYPINTRFSLRPLIDSLKNIIASGKPGAEKLYAGLMEELERSPELLEPITDPGILEKNKGIVDALIATVFPPTKINSQSLYSVAIPFTFETVYSSRYFKQLFLVPGTNTINVPDNELGRRLERDKLNGLYELILRKFSNHDFSDLISTVYPFANPATGLTTFLELQLDTRFVDIKPVGELPQFPSHVINKQTNRLMPVDEFFEQVSPDQFIVEGLIIVRVNDVTETEIISQIKNLLLKINAFSENVVYEQLQSYIQSLLNMKDIKIGITPFLEVNDHYVYSESHNNNSILFKNITTNAEKDEMVDTYRLFFRDTYWPLVFEDLENDIQNYEEQLGCYFKEGCRSLIICPLKTNTELLGVLEIVADEAGKLNRTHIAKIESAIPLFALAVEKSAENLDGQVDKV
ncbi:MAG TPA: GAF domain-containing protein, partial [Chitinophagaceae bacterium]